jgi:nicotinamide-nucleotide amidase
MIQAEIITIGDEILIGQIVDTNSAWMAAELNLLGIGIYRIQSISDKKEDITEVVRSAMNRSKVVIITGGLGPTKDDITKQTLCELFNSRLVFNKDVYQDVEQLFRQRGREVTELNRRQAEVPEDCIVLRNAHGTAPGMWFSHSSGAVISLPGVPYEMKALMQNEVLPRIKDTFRTPSIYHKTLLTQGIGESILAEQIADWENALPEELKLAYLPSVGTVRLRLSAYNLSDDEAQTLIEREMKKLERLVRKNFFGYDHDTLEGIIGKLLTERNESLAVAESCTGGALASRITRVAGASKYFKGGVIAYSQELKHQQLGVDEQYMHTSGLVNQTVAEAMAKGARERMNADWAIATTGVAGPGGGTTETPVGMVWIAACGKDKIISRYFLLGQHRERIIEGAVLSALQMLRKLISDES